MKWQRRLRAGIALFAAGFLVVLYLAFRPAGPASGPGGGGPVVRDDPAASAQSTSGELQNLLRDVENYRIEFDTHLLYPDGRQKVTGARVTVPNRGGRDFKVKAKEAEVGTGQDHIRLRGSVQLEASDGLTAATEEATFSQSEGILRAPGPASFVRGRMSGSSVGMTYDQHRDLLAMLDKAAMVMEPERQDDTPVEITSGAAVFARADHVVRYEREFRLVSGARTLASTLATAYLTDDGARVESLDMRGGARITGLGAGAGALRAMQADSINLEFAPDGRTVTGATLASERPGLASLELDGDTGTRVVAGQWIDVRLAPDGATVSALTVRESVELTLPATAAEPPRSITAATLTAAAEGGDALNAARFDGDVAYRESPPGGTPRTVLARALEVATGPGFGAMNDARFTGAVRFEEGALKASSARARYLPDRGRIELDGAEPATGQPPRVSDGQLAIDAGQIDITTDPRRIEARQDVRSVMLPVAQGGASGQGPDARRAGMLESDQPVYATAGALEYDSVSKRAVYTAAPPAQARLWQGDTTLQADRLVVDDATGNLAGTGRVATTLIVEERDGNTGGLRRVPSIGSANEFLYEDGPRKAAYSGSAHVSGPQGDLRAVTIHLYLARAENELERVEAYTSVDMRDEARTVAGDRLTYVSAEGRYVVVGSPVKIQADCRETTGRTLTFWKSTNNIVVEPSEEFRTQVKAIPKCGGPGRE